MLKATFHARRYKHVYNIFYKFKSDEYLKQNNWNTDKILKRLFFSQNTGSKSNYFTFGSVQLK